MSDDARPKPPRLRPGDTVAIVAPANPWSGRSELLRAVMALEAWDLRLDLASAGAPLFRELLAAFGQVPDAGPLFKVPFDAAEPVATPNTLADAPATGPDPVLLALARAIEVLAAGGHGVAVTLGELQYTLRGSERIPIHGGSNLEGAFNIVGYNPNSGTLLPGLQSAAPVSPPAQLTAEGYPINVGSSFIMVVHFAEGGPQARALLTYSQSSDPDSEHFGDQTRRFSEEAWRPVLFTDEAIEADPNLVEEEIVGPR